MDAALKQRLVGAIVLVALGVIFLPMVFDGSGTDQRLDVAIQVPDEPAVPDSRIDDTPEPVAVPAETAPEPKGGDTASASSAPGSSGDQAAGAQAAPSTRDEASPSGGSEAGAGNGDDNAGKGSPSAWVVQVGSFARKTNALVLRDRLRQDGHDAFVEKGDSGGKTVWRVRVGPVPTEDRAQKLREEIERERNGKSALVMSYP